MSKQERITIKEYDTTDDAKAAEQLLLQGGLTKDSVLRTGKRVKVNAADEMAALAMLSGSDVTTLSEGGIGMDRKTDVNESITDRAVDTVQDAASAVTGTVQQAAGTVADTVQQAASTVADTVQNVAAPVTDQVAKVGDVAADQVQNLADTVRDSGTAPGALPVQRQVAQTTSNVLDKTAEYLRERSLGLIVSDLENAVRRNPVPAVLLGLGLGYLVRSTFFPAASTGSTSGTAQRRQLGEGSTSSARSIPVFSAETATDIDVLDTADTYSTGTSSSLTSGYLSDVPPLPPLPNMGNVAPSSADLMTGTDLVDTMSPPMSDTTSFASDVALGSDTLATSGLSDEGLSSADAGLIGADMDTDVDTILVDTDTVDDTYMGSSSLDADASMSASRDSFGGETSDTSLDSMLGNSSDDTSTGPSSTTGGLVPDDMLRQWDNSTRHTNE